MHSLETGKLQNLKMTAKKVDCKIYLLYQETMLRHSSETLINYAKARWVLAEYRVPKYLRMQVIKEMIDHGYLERLNKDAIKINLD